MLTRSEYKVKRRALLAKCEAIQNAAKDRDMTDNEGRDVDALLDEIDVLDGKPIDPAIEGPINTHPLDGRAAPPDPSAWFDTASGREIRVLGRKDRMADQVEAPVDMTANDANQLSFGRYLRGIATGRWDGAELEHRVMGTGDNVLGGYLVPAKLAARVIDRARDRSVLIAAGAQTVPITSDNLSIARVNTDPTISTKAENAAFSAVDVNFVTVNLYPQTIGCLVKASRELIEDSINGAALIEQIVADALAAQIDKYGLVGTGSAQPLGILNSTGIGVQTTAIGGALDYDGLLDAVEDVYDSNGEPNAYVVTPAISVAVAKLKVNSEANHYATAPPLVAEMTEYVTNAMDSGNAIVGAFENVMIGVRQDAKVEVSTEADDAFEKHQVHIKVTYRGDFALEHADQFVTLTGIS